MTKKRNFEHFACIVDGVTYNFKAYTTDTRSGFCHTVVSEDYAVTDTKVSYCNRTWESFRYESALRRAIAKFPAGMQPAMTAQLIEHKAAEEEKRAADMFDRFQALHSGLSDENKKRLADSGIEIQTEDQARAVMGLMGLMTLLQN